MKPIPSSPITVRVTKADIAHGKLNDCQKCPVARALKRRLKRRGGITVRSGDAYLFSLSPPYDEEVTHTADLPARAITFIDCFDMNEDVKPFSFKLRFKEVA